MCAELEGIIYIHRQGNDYQLINIVSRYSYSVILNQESS